MWLARRGSDGAVAATGSSSLKRLAVLPFGNLGAAEDEYFADGMTDEVRGKLAGLSGLVVIASGSASQYKATTKPPEQIARELGVAYLLVAKVRWQNSGKASRIRLTAELVDLAGGGAPTTRWQEAFEADLSDVFRVQGEIATKVAQSLDVALSGKERGQLTAPPTSNLAAYDAYLRGLEIAKAGGMGTQRRAAVQYEQAVALDPGFALAWARLSEARSLDYRFRAQSAQVAEEAARKAAERAMELAPSLPEGHAALGDYYHWVRKDPEKAIEAYARGLNLAPDDALLLRGLARAERARGRWEEALAHLRRARGLDPRSWTGERQLGITLCALRRTGEAREACDRGLVLAPANIPLIALKAETFLQEGDLAGARAVLAAAPKEVEPTALVVEFATGGDLYWVLDDARRDVLLRLTPGAFDGDRWDLGARPRAGVGPAGGPGESPRVRRGGEKSVRRAGSGRPGWSSPSIWPWRWPTWVGRPRRSARESGWLRWSRSRRTRSRTDPYVQHQLVRIHILARNHERALELLEPLLKLPYHLTPAWLRIDPNFDPLRGNPRFEKLARGS